MSGPWTDAFASAPERSLPAGADLFRQGDRVRYLYLVRRGAVALNRVLPDGTALTLHLAQAGALVADASVFLDAYHCSATCREDTVVARLSRRAALECLGDGPLALDALAEAARKVQELRTRVEVMRLRRVADRLSAYLALHGPPRPGHWVDVADWIGVSPPALYRELARRRG